VQRDEWGVGHSLVKFLPYWYGTRVIGVCLNFYGDVVLTVVFDRVTLPIFSGRSARPILQKISEMLDIYRVNIQCGNETSSFKNGYLVGNYYCKTCKFSTYFS